MTRRHDVRRLKAHRTYTAAELAHVMKVNITTISRWRRDGLAAIDDRVPYLYAGATAAEFLRKRNKPRQPLQPGEIYCVTCKRPCAPLGGAVDLVPRTSTSGDFTGTCPRCSRTVLLRVRVADIEARRGTLTVRYEDETVPISSNGTAPHTAQQTGREA